MTSWPTMLRDTCATTVARKRDRVTRDDREEKRTVSGGYNRHKEQAGMYARGMVRFGPNVGVSFLLRTKTL